MESSREFIAVGEGPLRARPHREFSTGPLGNRRSGLKRSMRDISNVVGSVEPVRRACEPVFDGTFLLPETIFRLQSSVLLEIRKNLLARNLRHFFPLRMDGIKSVLSFVRARSGYSDKVSVSHDDYAFHGPRCVVIPGSECRPKRRWAQHFSMQHPFDKHIRRVLMLASHNNSAIS